jgi:hypothetical protein
MKVSWCRQRQYHIWRQICQTDGVLPMKSRRQGTSLVTDTVRQKSHSTSLRGRIHHPTHDSTSPRGRICHPTHNSTSPRGRIYHPTHNSTSPRGRIYHPTHNSTTPRGRTIHPTRNSTSPRSRSICPISVQSTSKWIKLTAIPSIRANRADCSHDGDQPDRIIPKITSIPPAFLHWQRSSYSY